MIVSASFRTDIPAFYGPWFLNRWRAGFARVINPYGGPPSMVSLRHSVDGFVFWTRHVEPFLSVLAEIRRAGIPFIIHYTITGYSRLLERSVPEVAHALSLVRHLAHNYGPHTVVWRYDPILISDLTPPAWHIANFSALAAALAGSVDEVVVSFMQTYRKTTRCLDATAREYGFRWSDPPLIEKRQAISRLTDLAARQGIRLRLCTQPHLQNADNAAACIDPFRLSEIAGHPIPAREKGNRPGCRCAESRDIGAYDSCPHGCVYCYAVNSRNAAKRGFAAHDPEGEFLIPPLSRTSGLD